DRLPWRRPPSIVATRSDNVTFRSAAISFSPFQNASSRLTLVLCPAITIDRLTTGDFIDHLLFRSGRRPARACPCRHARRRAGAQRQKRRSQSARARPSLHGGIAPNLDRISRAAPFF